MNKAISRNDIILVPSLLSNYAFFERMRKDKNYYNAGVQKLISFNYFFIIYMK